MGWDNLPLKTQQVAMVLGYNRERWNNDEEPGCSYKDWNDLTEAEREAALALGYDMEAWNSYS